MSSKAQNFPTNQTESYAEKAQSLSDQFSAIEHELRREASGHKKKLKM
jgi:hypothetical protein